MKRYHLFLFHILLTTFSAFAVDHQNLGYELKVTEVGTHASYEGKSAGAGHVWQVLTVEIRNRIDPFLVFDYGVDEKIHILSLQDRAFLLSGDGSLYRLNAELFGKEGHFGKNIRLEKSGSKVSGKLAFLVPESLKDSELHWIDESFAPVVVPVVGKVPDELLPATGSMVLENAGVSLAVGDHGPIEVEGQRAANGMQFYFVDLWGKSRFKRPVKAYYLEENADPDAMAAADFYFEYKKADQLINLIAEDGFAYAMRSEQGQGETIYPAFVSRKWSRVRLTFEIPDDASRLRLESLFGKMGMSEGEQSYLDALVFPLKTGVAKRLPIASHVTIVDPKDSNQLTVSVALVPELEMWGVDSDEWVGLWVQLENTGAEPGMIEPGTRFWFDASGDSVFPAEGQPGNRYAPPGFLFLDLGHARTMLLLYPRERLKKRGPLTLCYSGIGAYRELEVDLDSSQLTLLPVEAADSPTNTAETALEPMLKTPATPPPSSPDKTMPNAQPVQAREPLTPEVVRAIPYKVELPPSPYDEPAAKQAMVALDQMGQNRFAEVIQVGFEDFEKQVGTVGGLESEPNDHWDQVSQAVMDRTFSATLEQNGRDYWKIQIPAAASDSGKNRRFDLLLSFPLQDETFKGLYCSIFNQEKQQILRSWMERAGSLPFQNLSLPAGEYFLLFENYGEQAATPYLFNFREKQSDLFLETEPNAWKTDFLVLKTGDTVQGVLGNRDEQDYFTWAVSERDAGQRSDLLILADHTEPRIDTIVYDENGEALYWQSGNGRVVLGDFSPAAGIYHVRIACDSDIPVRYQLQIHPRDSRPVAWEREPNDVIQSRNLQVIDAYDDSRPELLGRLEARYGDFFAIHVVDRDHLYHVTLGGSGKLELSMHDKRKGRVVTAVSTADQPASLVDLRLPLGLSYFSVSGDRGDYAVNVQQVPIPGDTFEWEPNNSEGQAQLMQLGTAYQGRLLNNRDDDYFRFVVRQTMHYRIRLRGPDDSRIRMELTGDGFTTLRQERSPEQREVEIRAKLLPGDYWIKLEAPDPGLGFYELMVQPDPTPENMIEEKMEGLDIETDETPLGATAFLDDFQEVVQHIRLHNSGADPLILGVTAASANGSILPGNGLPNTLNLNPGETKKLEIPWVLSPQIPGSEDSPVYVGFSQGNKICFAAATIDPSTEVVAGRVLPGMQTLEDALAGAVNLNASDLGAKPVLEPATLYGDGKVPSDSYLDYLIDGVLANRSFRGTAAVVELAGDGTQLLVGTSMDLHGSGNLWEGAKDFAVDISMDGASFAEIFSGTLKARTGDQYFVFPEPVHARFARLRLLSTQSGNADQIPHLGEWRMLADPQQIVSTLGDIDLLDEKLGGHRIREEDRQSRVYGFQHDRCARLHSLIWQNKEVSSTTYGNAPEVMLEISEESPVGPWRTLGRYDLTSADSADSLTLEIPLDGEPWARFLRLSWENHKTASYTNPPEKVSLIEKPVSQTYRSVLGEWEGPTPFAFKEYLAKLEGGQDRVELKRIQSSQVIPYRLVPETWVDSVAWINESWEDWYEIEPVNVKKQLKVAVEAKPFVKVAVQILDDRGKPLDVAENSQGAYRKTFTFLADAGVSYQVHVYEPKRSIVYLWDVSGSMSRFVESIENAVLKFADDIDPISEKVQLLPFDEPPVFLTDGWVSDSYDLQSMIRNYDAPSSSYAHLNLLEATQALATQEGTKAAIVITDCESSRDVNNKLWQALEKVKPAVFTFQTSDQTSAYRIEQDDMQDWAAVAGGFYHNTRATQELDTAFEKVQAYLRRPAPYRIHLTAPELKPAFIEVKDARDKSTVRSPEKDGVLLIIDASASMRENLPDGQMKVTAAKAVIQDLVEHALPAGVNFGLRVFGHRGSADCASELMIPVTPLQVDRVKQQLMLIRSSSLGNTALGEALGWAKEDLKTLEGLKRVVVLTDGEETCHGDPAAAIAGLAAAGMDVTVNIVGFTLGDADVKSSYGNWVKSTGGKYYDAQDAQALGNALREAMTPVELPKYEIYDSSGALIKSGQVGDGPTEVESGVYKVKILDPEHPLEEIVEAFERSVTIDYHS